MAEKRPTGHSVVRSNPKDHARAHKRDVEWFRKNGMTNEHRAWCRKHGILNGKFRDRYSLQTFIDRCEEQGYIDSEDIKRYGSRKKRKYDTSEIEKDWKVEWATEEEIGACSWMEDD